MAIHAMLAHHIWVHKVRQPDQLVDLANLDNSGVDLLDLASDMQGQLQPAPVKDGLKFTRFDEHELRQRSLRFKGSSGRYGADRQIIDIISGEHVGDLRKEHAPLAMVRNALVVPALGQHAVVLTENYAGHGVYGVWADQLKARFKERFRDDLTLKIEGLAEPQVWAELIKRVELESIAAVAYETRDRGARQRPETLASLKVEKAGWRGRKLKKEILEAAVTGATAPHLLVGMSEPFADDVELHVTVNDGRRSKTYIIGRERWPTTQEVIAPDEAARPTDDEFWTFVSDSAPSLLKRLQVDLPPGWDAEIDT